MGRTLPWKKDKTTTTGPTRGRSQARTTSTTAKTALPSSSVSRPATSNKVLSRLGTNSPTPPPPSGRCNLASDPDNGDDDDGRDDATNSLPPTPRHPKPLPENCMVPGFQNDDRWRMVEDEFVAVAHKFTAHLHASEYQRLKKLAREQKTDAVLSISRSVTAPMTSAVRRRQAARSLEASQTRGIKRALSKGTNADDKEGGDEIPWAGTNLHTLMESPRKKPVSLSKLLPASTSNTRAAALNRQNAASSGTEPARPSRRITPTAAPSKPPSHHSTAPPAASSRPLTTATRDVSAAPDGSTQDDDDSDSDGYSARRRRRRAERARGRHKTTPEVTDTEENRSNHSSNQKSMGQHAWSIPSI